MYTNKQIWSVSYPILLSLLAQNVINVTDTAFLGRVSEIALGASAMGGLFYICIFTIAFGFSTGSQIVIARRNGEARYGDVGPVMIQGVLFLLVMALLLFGFTKAFGGNIMRLLVSSESIYDATMEFLDWRIFGFFFSFVNVMFRALYIGITRTKVLTINAVVMALTNVVLDYALIFGHFGLPEMGIKGAAIASVIGFSALFPDLYVHHRQPEKVWPQPLAVVRPGFVDAHSQYIVLHHASVFPVDGHLVCFLCGSGEVGTARTRYCQHREKHLHRYADSGKCTGHHDQQPGEQRHRRGRHQLRDAVDKQNRALLFPDHAGTGHHNRPVPTSIALGIHQRNGIDQ